MTNMGVEVASKWEKRWDQMGIKYGNGVGIQNPEMEMASDKGVEIKDWN